MGWRVWSILGTVVAIVAVMEQVEIDDIGELLLAEKSVVLTRQRPKVFQVVGDLRMYPQWHPGVKSVEATDTAPMSIGKHFTAVYDQWLTGETAYDVVISAYESPSHISFLTDCWTELRTEITVERRKQGSGQTVVTWRAFSRKSSYLFRFVLSPILQFVYTQTARQTVLNLKYLLQK